MVYSGRLWAPGYKVLVSKLLVSEVVSKLLVPAKGVTVRDHISAEPHILRGS